MADTREKSLEEMLEEALDYARMCREIKVFTGGEQEDPYKIAADRLIANGVTVQDGKPLEAFLHPIDAYEGLKAKYLVFKADTGEQVANCFVLRPDKDPAAVEALRSYANATDNETLAEDIYNWIGKGVTVQEWIPVTERLPEAEGEYITYTDKGQIHFDCFCIYPNHGTKFWVGGNGKVTHWMPLPEPPKEDTP